MAQSLNDRVHLKNPILSLFEHPGHVARDEPAAQSITHAKSSDLIFAPGLKMFIIGHSQLVLAWKRLSHLTCFSETRNQNCQNVPEKRWLWKTPKKCQYS